MRRSSVAVAGVTSAVVLVLSYRASVHGPLGPAAVVVAAPPPQTRAPSIPPSAAATPAPLPTAGVAPTSPRATAAPRPAVRPTAAPTRVPAQSRAPSPVAATVRTTVAPPVTRLVTGGVAQTPYGPVQVQIAVSAGRITGARTLQQPSGDPHSVSLASYAVPRLDQETLAAQSARIDVVTGATYTSEGYIGSLQSALDAAGLR